MATSLAVAIPRRRTQEERSTRMRARLLDATVDCLARLGYAGTTTTEIAKRARVSRGAQLHHYPRKEDLVIASVEHVFRLRLEEFGKAFASVPIDTDRRPVAVELLWKMFQGPVFNAWLELVVAARTDKALREALSEMNERFQGDIRVYFKEIFGPSPLTTDFELIPAFIFTLMDGMAMRVIVGNDEENEQILNLLKRYATLFLADRRTTQTLN
ncbi:MAG TPA: TetR/AcrR family transcriptional regulator [Candidatus Binataceae bacterium]|nr:TetR/AcrR family transcriptional regulator [Candidatus Binataceae bacterium]